MKNFKLLITLILIQGSFISAGVIHNKTNVNLRIGITGSPRLGKMGQIHEISAGKSINYPDIHENLDIWQYR